jgi:hypothetical protein
MGEAKQVKVLSYMNGSYKNAPASAGAVSLTLTKVKVISDAGLHAIAQRQPR